MERTGLVQDVEIEHEGRSFRASYFVQDSTIHANVGGRMLLAPLAATPASETVKALLVGHLQQQTRKVRNVDHWISVMPAK